jgi:uncharacterized protein YndB with AHSA1/START domain
MKPSREIRITRVYDAPVQMVWDAWTDLSQVSQWWGPRGFTITTHSKELRVGGWWHYTMHGPDGTDYENTTKYLEVVPGKKLVYDHGGHKERPPLFRVTAQFKALGDKTELDMSMLFDSVEARDSSRKLIKKAGGEGTWDRLAEHLHERTSGAQTFVIARSVEAPIEQVFEMWTDPRHLAAWLPPAGAEMNVLDGKIAAGQAMFWSMKGPHGVLYGKSEYLAIEPPTRIVYIQSFVDEHRQPSRHPMAPVWPPALLTTVGLTDEGDGRTRVSVTWAPHGPCTAEELAAFVKERPGMTQGWTGSFDKLEALLARP